MKHPLAPLHYSTIAPSHRERSIKEGRWADRTVARWIGQRPRERRKVRNGSGEVLGGQEEDRKGGKKDKKKKRLEKKEVRGSRQSRCA